MALADGIMHPDLQAFGPRIKAEQKVTRLHLLLWFYVLQGHWLRNLKRHRYEGAVSAVK